jgi:hypothetical protein
VRGVLETGLRPVSRQGDFATDYQPGDAPFSELGASGRDAAVMADELSRLFGQLGPVPSAATRSTTAGAPHPPLDARGEAGGEVGAGTERVRVSAIPQRLRQLRNELLDRKRKDKDRDQERAQVHPPLHLGVSSAGGSTGSGKGKLTSSSAIGTAAGVSHGAGSPRSAKLIGSLRSIEYMASSQNLDAGASPRGLPPPHPPAGPRPLMPHPKAPMGNVQSEAFRRMEREFELEPLRRSRRPEMPDVLKLRARPVKKVRSPRWLPPIGKESNAEILREYQASSVQLRTTVASILGRAERPPPLYLARSPARSNPR